MKKIFFYLLLFLIVGIALEFSCNILLHRHSFMVKTFGNSDIFWETYFLNNHKSGKIDSSTCFIYDQELGWKSKNSCSGLINGISFSTDSLGMRNIPYHGNPQAKDRVLFIGDSFTEGAEVADSCSYPALFQKLRPGMKVFNSGTGGYSHSQMLLSLPERIRQTHPTQVVLGFVNDDVSRNQLTFNGFAKPAYSIKDGNLVLKNGNVKPPEVILDEQPYKSSAYLMLRFLLSKKNAYSVNDDIEVAKLLINEMNEMCKKNNIGFKVVFIPTANELYQIPGKNLFEPFETYFTNHAISFYSLEKPFKKIPGIYNNAQPGGHWNERANILIAQEIANSCFE